MKTDLTACPALQKLFKLSLKLSAVLYCQIYPTTIFGCEEKTQIYESGFCLFSEKIWKKGKNLFRRFVRKQQSARLHKNAQIGRGMNWNFQLRKILKFAL